MYVKIVRTIYKENEKRKQTICFSESVYECRSYTMELMGNERILRLESPPLTLIDASSFQAGPGECVDLGIFAMSEDGKTIDSYHWKATQGLAPSQPDDEGAPGVSHKWSSDGPVSVTSGAK